MSPRYAGKILAVGSILPALAAGDTVWGAGMIKDEPFEPPPGVRFLAVRGPLTRDRVQADVPEIYGDPALLTPRFYSPPVVKEHTIGIVPHYVDYEALTVSDPVLKKIDVRRPWRDVIDAIRSCDFIISSSLHGLIVAEAYGLPASWIRVTDRVAGGSFKFNDYYLSTGRDMSSPKQWPARIDDLIRSPAPPPVFDPAPLLRAAQQMQPFDPDDAPATN